MNLSGQDVGYWRKIIYTNFDNLGFVSNIRSLIYVVSAFFLNIFCFILIDYLVTLKCWSLVWVAYLVVGYTYYQYQFLMHEASHAVLFSNRKVNDYLGFCFGVITGYTFSSYRANHMKHHKFLGTDLDPENGNFIKDDRTKIKYILFKSFFCVDAIKQFIGFFSNEQVSSVKKRSTIRYSFLFYSSILLSLYFYNHWDFLSLLEFLIMLAMPIVTLTFLLNRLRTICEHPLGVAYQDSLYTVTHRRGILWNCVLASFNFNYHLEHHLVPEISSGHYPKINKLLVSMLPANKAFK